MNPHEARDKPHQNIWFWVMGALLVGCLVLLIGAVV